MIGGPFPKGCGDVTVLEAGAACVCEISPLGHPYRDACQPHGQPLTGHGDEVLGLAFGPDRQLASASADQLVRLWNIDFTSWREHGCSMVNRNLSGAEWDQLLPGLPYERTCPELPPGTGAPPDSPAAAY